MVETEMNAIQAMPVEPAFENVTGMKPWEPAWRLPEACLGPAADLASSHWYAVQTRSRFERKAATDIAERGVEVYLPLVSQVHQWSDRLKRVESPLFPGYLFVRIPNTPQFRLSVLRGPGVVRFLGCDGSIQAVPDIEVDSVRQLLLSSRPFLPHPFVREGTRVRVRGGALRGVEGIFVRVRNEARVVISVELFSQAVATEVDAANLEVIHPN